MHASWHADCAFSSSSKGHCPPAPCAPSPSSPAGASRCLARRTAVHMSRAHPALAPAPPRSYLVHVRQNARQGNASTLTRSEVRGGGRKPYKQKGSGNARRGTRRSPLMPGGGISFGPKPRDWTTNMNKKVGAAGWVLTQAGRKAGRKRRCAVDAARSSCICAAVARALLAGLRCGPRREAAAASAPVPGRGPMPSSCPPRRLQERKLALATALQSAAADMIVCDDFSALDSVKTQALVAGLGAMGADVEVSKGRQLLPAWADDA